MKPNPWKARGLALQLATLGVAIAFSSNARAEGLTFEKAFDVKNEPATIHYQAAFEANGKVHQLEVWRDGDRRLKRRTEMPPKPMSHTSRATPSFACRSWTRKK